MIADLENLQIYNRRLAEFLPAVPIDEYYDRPSSEFSQLKTSDSEYPVRYSDPRKKYSGPLRPRTTLMTHNPPLKNYDCATTF